VFYSAIKYGCYFYLPRKFMNENTLSERKVSESLCILLCVLYPLKNIFLYENINSIVNVKDTHTV